MKKRARRRLLKVPTIAEATKTTRTEVLCVYRGLDLALDSKIKKLARRELEGSGMELGAHLRDLSFFYMSEAKAVAAAKRIKAAHLPVRVLIGGYWSP
jgi:hypothetical protein